jgi:hypothetical protein
MEVSRCCRDCGFVGWLPVRRGQVHCPCGIVNDTWRYLPPARHILKRLKSLLF